MQTRLRRPVPPPNAFAYSLPIPLATNENTASRSRAPRTDRRAHAKNHAHHILQVLLLSALQTAREHDATPSASRLGAPCLRACPPPFHQSLLLREAHTREASVSSQDRGTWTVAPRPQFASAQRQQQRELAAVSSPCSRAAAGKWMKVGIVSGGETHEERWLVTAPSRMNRARSAPAAAA